MPAISAIPLRSLSLLDPCAAPAGCLVQYSSGNPTVGMRSDLPASNGVAHLIVPLEGSGAGRAVNVVDLTGPVVDLSELAEIMIVNVAPDTKKQDADYGDVYSVTVNGANVLALRPTIGPGINGWTPLVPHPTSFIPRVDRAIYVGRVEVWPIT